MAKKQITLSVDTFKQQVLPSMIEEHSCGIELQEAIKSFLRTHVIYGSSVIYVGAEVTLRSDSIREALLAEIEKLREQGKSLSEQLAQKFKEEDQSAPAKSEAAKWERVRKEGWRVSVSSHSQKEADDRNESLFLIGYSANPRGNFETSTSILRYKYCSTIQGPNIRQPYFGGQMPVGASTILTIWRMDGFVFLEMAGDLNWSHSGSKFDIMSFMIHPKVGAE